MEKIDRWFSGPSFLWSKDRDWQSCENISPVSEKDPELRKEMRLNVAVTDETIISRIFLLTTRWLKLKKIMAWVMQHLAMWKNL